MISDAKMSIAEEAIINLADTLGVSEEHIIEIIEEGMMNVSPIAGQLSNKNDYFLKEMKSAFNIY